MQGFPRIPEPDVLSRCSYDRSLAVASSSAQIAVSVGGEVLPRPPCLPASGDGHSPYANRIRIGIRRRVAASLEIFVRNVCTYSSATLGKGGKIVSE